MFNKYFYRENIYKLIIFFIVSSILIFVDYFTKRLVTLNLTNGKKIKLFNDILEFFYFENKGAAFGILQGKQLLFVIVTIIVLIVLFFYLIKLPIKKKNLPLYVVMILIFSGAIGNFIERVTKGYVVDFIYFKPIDFPVFNVADSYITIACFLLMYLVFFYYKDEDLKF